MSSAVVVAMNSFQPCSAVATQFTHAKRELIKARNNAQIAICIDWAVNEMINFSPSPESPTDLIAHAKKNNNKLEGKGVTVKDGMPPFMGGVLDSMIAKGETLAPHEAAANPGGQEAAASPSSSIVAS
jgi:hypothetical protein